MVMLGVNDASVVYMYTVLIVLYTAKSMNIQTSWQMSIRVHNKR